MSFRVLALPGDLFSPLFRLSDEALRERNIVRKVADGKPGFPCRVSLADAEPGESVLLLNFEHQPALSPFRASHAIYVRENAPQARCEIGEVPPLFRSRTISVRGFDESHMLIEADLVEGTALESGIDRVLANEAVSYVHLHYAKPGCYAARVERA